jgi:hypothetical protein
MVSMSFAGIFVVISPGKHHNARVAVALGYGGTVSGGALPVRLAIKPNGEKHEQL